MSIIVLVYMAKSQAKDSKINWLVKIVAYSQFWYKTIQNQFLSAKSSKFKFIFVYENHLKIVKSKLNSKVKVLKFINVSSVALKAVN